ncbi:ribosomal RNA processing protein 1 homolog [Nymphalis io]|uniref:ribosomal RNA processing protein 1 homolog n=1 Tax=Inachis io TaxID=171585 RepID=UPI002169C927|nr:ribosomal RNA processing protein 1 homolog [Nymphalis io]
MKLPEKKKPKKQKIKKKTIAKPKKEKVLLVAQEFKFARLLSENEKKTRDRVLKTFKKWLLNCFEKGYEFKEEDFIRVWKGLFYAVWMSDKPLVQEDLCESISEILDLFPPEHISSAMLMSKAGFKVLATEWYGIDQHRMDKFLMLVRRYLRGSLRCLLRCNWSLESCTLFADMLSSGDGLLALTTPLYARNALSLVLHIMDCYLEEISKVSRGEIPGASLARLLRPASALVCGAGDARAQAARRVLGALVRQSALGLRYEHKARAWQLMGCPAGGPDALELMSDDEADEEVDPDDTEDVENGALDPRAGRVHVVLRPLPVPAALLAEQLRQLLAGAGSRAYTRARICAERFEELARNNYPLKVPDTDAQGLEPNLDRAEPMRAASRLQKLEKTLITASDELALRGLSKKHRKRLLARSRSGLSIVDEIAEGKSDSANGDWQVETTKTDDKTKKEESNKENKASKKKNRKRKLQKEDNVPQVDNKKPKTNKIVTNNDTNKVKTNEKQVNNKKVKPNNTNNNQKQTEYASNKPNMKQNDDTKAGKQKKNKKKLKKEKDKKLAEEPAKVLSVNNADNTKGSPKPKTNDKQTTTQTNVKRNSENKNAVNGKPNRGKLEPKLVVNKVKKYEKQTNVNNIKKDSSPKKKAVLETPKKVKFVLKNNSMQAPVDYYKSVRQSPSIPFDSSKQPNKTNLKPSTPSPINPFFKKKFKSKF